MPISIPTCVSQTGLHSRLVWLSMHFSNSIYFLFNFTVSFYTKKKLRFPRSPEVKEIYAREWDQKSRKQHEMQIHRDFFNHHLVDLNIGLWLIRVPFIAKTRICFFFFRMSNSLYSILFLYPYRMPVKYALAPNFMLQLTCDHECRFDSASVVWYVCRDFGLKWNSI